MQLTPAADRPYVGGSTNNSELNLIFGYNGFGRLSGNETGSVGGHGAAGSMWGPTGWNRLFLSSMGGQISWLIPGSLIGLVAVLWLTRRAPRTDRVRAAFLIFGGWLLVTGAVFSFAHGIIHPYYTVALAPAIGALVGMGASTLWRRRQEIVPRLALAVAILASIAWAFVILGWSPTWYPALRWVVLVAGVAAALAIALLPRARGVLAAGIAGFGIASIIAAPAAYALNTAATPHSGAIPSAGPAIAGGGGFGGPGGFTGGGFGRRFGGGGFGGGGFGGQGRGGGITVPKGFTLPNGTKLPNGLHIPAGAFPRVARSVVRPEPVGAAGFGGGFGRGAADRWCGWLRRWRAGWPGWRRWASSTDRPLASSSTALLGTDASRYSWVAATTGSNSASGYQLATGDPVMAIGGFNGTDPAPTLSQFETVRGRGKDPLLRQRGRRFWGWLRWREPGTSHGVQIESWVTSHFTAQTVDGVTIYNLTERIALTEVPMPTGGAWPRRWAMMKSVRPPT